jgi:hypothetical protein
MTKSEIDQKQETSWYKVAMAGWIEGNSGNMP